MRFYTVHIKRLYPVFAILAVLACLTPMLLLLPQATKRFEESLTASVEASMPQNIVILDAGHGGEDCGAVGESGVFEKDLNLSIASEVAKQLTERGYTVVMTRSEDRLLYTEEQNVRGMRKIYDLKNRCAISEAYPDALFVSIHMNSFGDARYDGLQVYYTPSKDESRRLAESIQGAVCLELQPQNHRKPHAGEGLYVLEHTAGTAVLVECGFLSNAEECARLCDADYQASLARSIAQGIENYKTASK